ncbi:hypothetical protein [Ancylobacter vacuolatus]|uniref:LTXXQ motif family protein n=1 Tax=Ancylobacter vacuolatus TaxID=223389 RepID=A0ABU0DHA0_9HYPH|nr:hypothetical protein [Ancylobacter vacuolatus]MDQ0347787.1 hypothetical protein [Ancylobacter vacuolatus]
MPTSRSSLHSLCLAIPMLLLTGVAPSFAAAPAGGLWPCIQRKVPELAAGQMWSGPPIDNLKWQDDLQVAELVPVLAAQRTPIDEATKQIDAFASTLGANSKERLTLLFAGLFEQINARRSRIMNGIERYAQHQIELSKRIKEESLAVAKAKKAAGPELDNAKALELEKQLLWDTRIYDARQQSMSAVCESPVLLEQRIFTLSRAIQEKLP